MSSRSDARAGLAVVLLAVAAATPLHNTPAARASSSKVCATVTRGYWARGPWIPIRIPTGTGPGSVGGPWVVGPWALIENVGRAIASQLSPGDELLAVDGVQLAEHLRENVLPLDAGRDPVLQRARALLDPTYYP